MVGSAPVTSAGPRSHTGEPLALALERLAQKAHEEGVQVLHMLTSAPAFLVSSSRPDHPSYVVTLAPGMLHGCDCEGVARWQRCKHCALCLDLVGWLPDVEVASEELDDQGCGRRRWLPPPMPPSAGGGVSPAPVVPVSLMSRADRRAAAAADGPPGAPARQAQAVAP